jgi:hypothetical protein
LRKKALVLDPFAGVGTTLIEAQRRGISSVGFEINPFAALAARAKLETAAVATEAFRLEIKQYSKWLQPIESALDSGDDVAAPNSTPPAGFRTRIPFFSASVERKVLHTLDYIATIDDQSIADLFKLAFASTMVSYSNYTYEPSLGSRPGAGKPLIDNADVCMTIANKLREMADDVSEYTAELSDIERVSRPDIRVIGFFDGASGMPNTSVNLVVTSPPYLNNYHYVRSTRPQLYWLEYISAPKDQHYLETDSFGKYWQTVRDGPQINLTFELAALDQQIRELRKINEHKGIYGGNGWANYAASYYNDSYRLVGELSRLLCPGGVAIIVVGNTVLQGVEFKVDGDLLAISRLLGLEGRSERIRRTRVGSSIMGTGARHKVAEPIELYEAAVILRRI